MAQQNPISGSGRYVKRTRETESFESRRRSRVTFESGMLPPAEGASGASGRSDGGGAASGGSGGGGGFGESGGGDRPWHEQAPEKVRLSVEEVRSAGARQAAALSGDYLLSLVERSQRQCRWTLALPSRCGLDQVVLVAAPGSEGRLALRAFFAGSVAGPAWVAQDVGELDGAMLRFDRPAAANPAAGCLWPESVIVTALAAQDSFYISPEPTAAERAVMATHISSGSSAADDPPLPADEEPPCEGPCECLSADAFSQSASAASSRWASAASSPSAVTSCPAECKIPPTCPNGACSMHPVRYFNGELQLSIADQASAGFGVPWEHRRIYSNRLTHDYDFGNGFNWQVRQWGYLRESASGVITVVRGPGANLWFDPDGAGGYVGRHGGKATLEHDAAAGLFRLRMAYGEEYAFHDFSQLSNPPGLFARHTAQGGQTTEATAYTADDRVAEIQRSLTAGGVTTTESFRYQYFTTGEQDGRLQYVTLRRQIGGGAWQRIGRSEYEYYGSTEAHGSLGDLKRARQQELVGSAWQDRDVHYYRYWKAADAKGFEHGLKYVLEPEGYAQLSAVADPLTAGDAQLAQYADYYYEYDAQRRVTKETVQAGALSYTFAYTDSAHVDGYNHWKRKTVETRPDGAQTHVYMNYIGQVLIKDLASGIQRWIEYRKYDSAGRLIERAQPSAVTSYDPGVADLDVSLKASAGLIEAYDYYAGTASGGAPGYLRTEWFKEGTDGVSRIQRRLEYAAHSAGGITIYPISNEMVFPAVMVATSYSYTFHSGTVQVEQRTTTLPAVPVSQNGSGVSDTRTERFDLYGNPTWTRDERGFIRRQTLDPATGALLQRIEDVDTAQTTDEPVGWTTPSGGGLHLVSDYEHDDRGRITQQLDPEHTIDIGGVATAVRRATWLVYADLDHELRSAQGYYSVGSGSYTLVNPVSIIKHNRKGQVREQIQAVRTSTAGKLTAGDSFAQSGYVRWTTYQYTDCCTLASQRVYHTIPATGEGTAGTNYDQTQFGYDSMKRRNRTASPGGTIRFDVFDIRDQVVRNYVGTDDTGATESDPTGGGATGNDMLLLTAYEYDGGVDGGAGNLTKETQHVDATTVRVTSYAYDWRNRRTATDGELDYYEAVTYDHPDRPFRVYRNDTTSSGNFVSLHETLYDDRGRVYRTTRYGVDRASGTVSGSQTEDRTYDEAGNLVRQEPAGSMAYQTFAYDSIGRRVTETDPLGHTRSFAYDAAGNLISMTDQNQEVWTRGYDALGRLVRSTNPLSESTTYGYNSAGEQTTVANGLGETTTTAYDAAGRIVSVSDPLNKVTSYGYDANGNQTSVTDPNNLTTLSDYDYLDRLVEVTDPLSHTTGYAYNLAGELTVETDAKSQDTTHQYDALGRRISTTDRLNQTTSFSWNVLGLQESITDAENQTTSYVYDDYGRLYQTIWPDHVSGSSPGNAGYGITQTEYDALHRVLRTTDQLGDTVTHSYDAAGRLLARDYRVRANSPSGTIADSDTFTYDDASRLLTAVSGRYSNTVTHTYDAAGRKATESLTISGQTYTSTSEYDAASRVSKRTYPDASEVTRSYTARGQLSALAAGLTTVDTRAYDDGGRLTSSSYNNGVSESRTYNNDNTLASISFSGAPIGTYSYSWDANKNKTAETITGALSGYGFSVGVSGYDAEDRLVNWQRSDTNLDQSWDLSPVGDWQRITENASLQNRTHGAAHELLTVASQSLQHDAKGNMTLIPAVLRPGGNPLALKWDFENRLSAADVDNDGTDDVFYRWDALGRRVGRDDGTDDVVYFQDGQQTLADYAAGAAAGSPAYTYMYADYIDEPVLRTDSSGTTLYYHRNQQYSITAVTGSTGTIQERYAYTAYGQPTILDSAGTTVLGSSAYGNRIMYTGREWDAELALYHYRARTYDPVAARFVSRDPIGYRDGNSLYAAYFAPSRLDPFGKTVVPAGAWPIPCGPKGTAACEAECAATGEVATSCKCFQRDITVYFFGFACRQRDKIAAPTCEKYKGNPGKCTKQQHTWLRIAKEVACNGARIPTPGMSCDRLAELYAKNLACAAARAVVAKKCFDDNDPTHKSLIDEHKQRAADASSYYMSKPCAPRPGLGQ